MKKFMIKFIDFWNASSLKKKIITVLIIILVVIAVGILTYFFVTKVFPIIIVIAFLVWTFASDHIQAQKVQQAQIQQEETLVFIRLYEETARTFLPMLMEYKTPLGIAPTTVNSIYSYEKCTRITNLTERVLIYSVERKAPAMIELSDLESAIQTRFDQMGLWLYLIGIDQRDSQFLKFYLLPITSENAYNWAIMNMQKKFQHISPQKPGNRKDKDF